jgi:hypothetical protein
MSTTSPYSYPIQPSIDPSSAWGGAAYSVGFYDIAGSGTVSISTDPNAFAPDINENWALMAAPMSNTS